MAIIDNLKNKNGDLIYPRTLTNAVYDSEGKPLRSILNDMNYTAGEGLELTGTVFSHPTTAGNKHIPPGGTVGQILKNTASGTATWQNAPTNAVDSVNGETGVVMLDGTNIMFDPNDDYFGDFSIVEAFRDYSIGMYAEIDSVAELIVDEKLPLKVDKVTGKGLSTNDFTTPLKDKLDGIEAGAEKNESITHLMPKSGGTLETYTEKLQTTTGTINLSLANVFTDTPNANRTYSITNATSGVSHSFTLIITQTATVRTLTFPSSVKWQGGEIPDLTTANKTYILTFMTTDGGSTWLGMFGGEF